MTLVKHIFEALSFTGIAVFLLWCIVYACLHGDEYEIDRTWPR